MAYPTRYRGSPRASPQGPLGRFLSDESGYVRFPGGDKLPFRVPLALPPIKELPQPQYPLVPPDPATRRQQDIPWFERGRGLRIPIGAALSALAIVEMAWPSGQATRAVQPIPSGYSLICGPVGWPGPPYMNAIRVGYFGPPASPPDFCGSGGQSLAGVDEVPSPSTSTIRYYYGPNTALLPLERYFVSQTVTDAGGALELTPIRMYAYAVPQYAMPRTPPGLPVEVVPSPSFARPYGRAGSLGDVSHAGSGGDFSAPMATPVTASRGGSRGLFVSPAAPDERPPPRDREKKLGPKVGAFFRLVQEFGNWNGLAYALWASLPARYRTPHANTAQRLGDLIDHWEHVDAEKAVVNLGKFYLGYLLGRAAYGRAQAHLISMLGPRLGWSVYRALVTGGYL
nr:MAG TPA: hypothetical protein [Microviridae sp.]